jgi:hypothetical protein
VNARKRHESPPLWLAADAGHLAVVRELLRAGAKANLKGQYDATPLHKAAEGGHSEVVRALLAAGADVNADYDRCMAESYAGWTALLAASEGGHRSMARDLLAAGANPNAATVLGYTPLLLAAAGRHRGVADLLRQAGATVDDETATHFLKVLDFAAAARTPEFRKAAAAVGKFCGIRSHRDRRFRDGALFNLGRCQLAGRLTPQVIEELAAEILAEGHITDEAAARKAAKGAVEYRIGDLVAFQVLEAMQEKLLARGFYLTEAKVALGSDFLALLPTDDKYAVLACLGPDAGSGIPFHIRWLKELEASQPFELAGCGYDTLKVRFPARVRDPEKLARRVYGLGRRGGRPDEIGVLHAGRLTQTDNIPQLVAALKKSPATLRLWWD